MGRFVKAKTNTKKFRAKLAAERRRRRAAVNTGVVKAARLLFEASQEIVPVETGRLRNSGRIDFSPKTQTARVIYRTPYAIIVHEDLSAAHGQIFNILRADEIRRGRARRKRPQEQAKFLTRPARRLRKRMIQIIRSETARQSGK